MNLVCKIKGEIGGGNSEGNREEQNVNTRLVVEMKNCWTYSFSEICR